MKNKILYVVFIGLLGVAAISVQYIRKSQSDIPGRFDALQPATSESRTIDYSDDKILLGNSHNAFVGKTLAKIGSKGLPHSIGPSSQYEVDVVYNIKGKLKGKVTVNQFEANLDINRKPLLQVGSTYVFATRYTPEEDLYLIVYYPWDYQLLTDNSALSNAELWRLAENSDRVKALQVAYPNEILGSDIRDHKTWNSYASRHYDANGELIDDTVELAKQRANAVASTAPATESAAPSASPESIPSVSESILPSSSAEPASSPTITPSAESPVPSPTEVPVQS